MKLIYAVAALASELIYRCLTFDVRGGRKQAKLAGGRPLDGRVRPRVWEHRPGPDFDLLSGLRDKCADPCSAAQTMTGIRIRVCLMRCSATH